MPNKARLSAAFVAGLAATGPLTAKAEPSPVELAVIDQATRRQPLSSALVELSAQTGIAIVFDNRLTRGLTAPGIARGGTLPAALDRMLRGTGLGYRQISNDTIVITALRTEPASAQVAAPVAPGTDAPSQSGNAIQAEDIIVVAMLDRGAAITTDARMEVPPALLHYGGSHGVAETLFDLPVFRASFTAANTASLGTPAGINLADLHGLGPSRTMVLLNGRKVPRTIAGNGPLSGVDLSALPRRLLRRIEVSDGFGGATIGDEALAGGVNFVLDDEIDGWRASAEAGITERGDGESAAASIAAGTAIAGGRGRMAATLAVERVGGLYAADREATANLYGYAADGTLRPGYGASIYTPEGLVGAVIGSDGRLRRTSGAPYTFNRNTGALEPFEGRLDQLYNFADDLHLSVPSTTMSFAAVGHLDFGRHRLSADVIAARTSLDASLAPTPLAATNSTTSKPAGDAVVVPLDNPFVPVDLRAAMIDEFGTDIAGIVVERRFVEVGPRRRDIERTIQRVSIGLAGPAGDWTYDAALVSGWGETRDTASGYVDAERLRTSVDPASCALDPACSLINVFGKARLTPEQAAYIAAPPTMRVIDYDLQVLSLSIQREFVRGSLAIGGELRREHMHDRPHPPYPPGFGSGGGGPTAVGTSRVAEIFADAKTVLLRDRPLIERFGLALAGRLSHHSDAGTLANFSARANWSPVGGITIDAELGLGERAPLLAELAARGPDYALPLSDPCLRLPNPTVIANCATSGPHGTPPGFQPTSELVMQPFIGNNDLKPERSRNWSIGAEMRRGAIEVRARWYDYRISNAIDEISAQSILDACYASVGLSSPWCGGNPADGTPYIVRDAATGTLQSVNWTMANGGRLDVAGLTARLDASHHFGASAPLDRIQLSILANYIHEARFALTPGAAPARYEGTPRYPRNRAFAQLLAEAGAATARLSLEYRGPSRSRLDSDSPDVRIAATVYADAGLQYRFGAFGIYGGVKNLFDRKLPVVAFEPPLNTLPELFDPFGRRYYLGIEARF